MAAALLLAGCADSREEDHSDTASPSETASVSASAQPSTGTDTPATSPGPGVVPPASTLAAPSSATSKAQPPALATPSASSRSQEPGETQEPGEAQPEPTTIATVEQAMAAWLADRGLEYAGPCEDTTLPEDAGAYCSRIVEDRGTAIAAMVGPTFAEFTEYVLILRTDSGWVVARSDAIPGPDEEETGLPF